MKKLAVILLFVLTPGHAQQWSNDPVVDHLKQAMSDLIKYQAFMEYCKAHANNDPKCAGANKEENATSTYVDWDTAMKMGSQKDSPKSSAPEMSLAEYARRQRIQTALEKGVAVMCKEKADFCKGQTSVQLTQKLIAQKGWAYWEQVLQAKR